MERERKKVTLLLKNAGGSRVRAGEAVTGHVADGEPNPERVERAAHVLSDCEWLDGLDTHFHCSKQMTFHQAWYQM